jgi:2-keto-4-pentenoate hydratase/2-oxohepta-3-ene-1,7-dioic acid hydratase in catechol pathway
MRDFVCFETHVEGVVRMIDPDAQVMPDWYATPQFYFTNATAIKGPGDPIEVPPGCERLDLELELGIVIGTACRDVTVEQASQHIAGVTIYNDFSARDLAARELRLSLGFAKAKDFANALGPWIVTIDELEPYRNGDRFDLEMSAYVNDRRLGVDTLANMAWSFEEMVVYASRGTTLQPGDVLGSGTCGAGCLAELWGRNGSFEPPPLVAGDEVRLVVEGIGELTNHIVPGVAPIPVPNARPRRTLPGEPIR